ncbi:MAG: hypothetical protein JNK82_34260 [Myxococcaceae bacterium]|nr:hypothetical protein [Myxococcaceae bacterium]
MSQQSDLVNLGLALDRAGGIALDVEPAGGILPPWAGVLTELGISPLGEDARFAAAQAAKQTKGAPLPEVEAVFAKLCGPANAALCAEAVARYRELATARPKKMFSHAMAAAKLNRYDEYAPGAYVLRCPSCGAPRLKAVLHCDFCGADIK